MPHRELVHPKVQHVKKRLGVRRIVRCSNHQLVHEQHPCCLSHLDVPLVVFWVVWSQDNDEKPRGCVPLQLRIDWINQPCEQHQIPFEPIDVANEHIHRLLHLVWAQQLELGLVLCEFMRSSERVVGVVDIEALNPSGTRGGADRGAGGAWALAGHDW